MRNHSFTNLIKRSYTVLQKQYRRNIINRNYKEYTRFIENAGNKVNKLTHEQKKKVDEIYQKYGFRYNYKTHELYQAVTGKFDPKIFPEDLFRTTVEYVLNNQEMRAAYIDKCYFDRYLPDIPYPKCICKNINGIYYDSDFNILSINSVLDRLRKYEKFVIKPSVETGFGRGVKLIECSEDLRSILYGYQSDFIIQEPVVQHKIFFSLNESSVNVMRINSLFLNGEVHLLSGTVRVGPEGSFTDVVEDKNGNETLLIGINENGCMRGTAYYKNGEKLVDYKGSFKFGGVQIPGWNKIQKLITDNHKILGHYRFIGWDVTIDNDENPIVIEYNVSGPGVLYYQYTNGPLFGKYTEDVMKYVEYKNNLNR